MSDDENADIKLPIKRDASSDESDLDDINDETSSVSDGDDSKAILGYRCFTCQTLFQELRKYRDHYAMKNSWCSRCKQIFFCSTQMKTHFIECQKVRVQRKYYRERRPWPKYLRGLEEHMKRRDTVYREGYKPEDPKKLEKIEL
jgi:DNA-directed RNA polymerase subunit RPC12/RpoP